MIFQPSNGLRQKRKGIKGYSAGGIIDGVRGRKTYKGKQHCPKLTLSTYLRWNISQASSRADVVHGFCGLLAFEVEEVAQR